MPRLAKEHLGLDQKSLCERGLVRRDPQADWRKKGTLCARTAREKWTRAQQETETLKAQVVPYDPRCRNGARHQRKCPGKHVAT
jgi:hypothetical protein